MLKLLKFIVLVLIILFIVNYFTDKTDIAPPPEENVVYTTTVNGITRTYTVYVPKSYDSSKKTSLIFVFHGGGSNSLNVQKTSDFDSRADDEGFLVAYPLGTVEDPSKSTVSASWNGGPAGGGNANSTNVDDIAFVRKMVSEISQKYNVDNNRIYATGISMGGMMSYRLACEMSDVFVAVAPVGSVLAIQESDCRPVRPISIIHFHGTKDRFIPFLGGPTDPSLPKLLVVGGPYISVNDSINFFKNKYGISSVGETVYEKGDSRCDLYSGDLVDVELCVVTDGGHTWPGSGEDYGFILSKILGKVSKDISATDIILKFFSSHSLR